MAASIAVLCAVLLAGCSPSPSSAPSPSPSETVSAASLAPVESLVVMGDSISLGVNACQTAGRCPAEAWATGTDPASDSLLLRLAASTGVTPVSLVQAGEGARLADLLDNVPRVARAKPQLVAILIGANDACATSVAAMTPAAAFSRDYARLLTDLHAAVPGATLLALSVPDISQLVPLGARDPAVVAAWNRSSSCSSLLERADSTAGADRVRRREVGDRVDAFNAAIADACSATSGCIGDDGGVHEVALTADDVSSIDHFHPSSRGQSAIADAAWTALTTEGKTP